MKILVTGGAGFIGSHVVDALVAAGHEVVALDDLSAGQRARVHPAARLEVADITDPELSDFMAAEGFEVVSHHAAHVSVGRSARDPVHDARVNVLGSVNLLQACVAGGVRKIVYASSGGAMYGEPESVPVPESHPARPISPYGVSKGVVEQYLTVFQRLHGLAFTSLRYPNVYGPRQDSGGEGGVVAIFGNRMLAGEPVTIHGAGEQTRDFLYVGDCAQANLLALTRGDGGRYNLGWGEGVSILHLFSMTRDLTGYREAPTHGPARPGDLLHSVLDAGKARRELGWTPRVALADGLRLTLAALSERQMTPAGDAK